MSVRYQFFLRFLSYAVLILIFAFRLLADPASKTTIDPEPLIENDGVLDLLSINIWGLPIWMPGHHNQFRFKKMPEQILKLNKDIVCLQEVFNKRARKKLHHDLVNSYYTNTNIECRRRIFGGIQMDCQGGLMTFSKYPILSEVFVPFTQEKKMSGIEKIGSKGFLISEIAYQNESLIVVNTHLYAGKTKRAEGFRYDQMKQIQDYLKCNSQFENKLILLIGDINITHPDVARIESSMFRSITYDYLTKEMQFVDTTPELTDCDYTVDPTRNGYVSNSEVRQKLDYCFIKNESEKSSSIIQQGTELHSDNIVSDHLAFSVSIQLSSNDITQP